MRFHDYDRTHSFESNLMLPRSDRIAICSPSTFLLLLVQERVGHLRDGEERGPGGGQEGAGQEGGEGEGGGEGGVVGWREGQGDGVGEGGGRVLDGDGGRGGRGSLQEEGGLRERLSSGKTESGDGGVGA